MFGPLNGVRIALVASAVVAAIAAAALGQWVVTVFLAAGVALHGAGWWFLWKQRPDPPATDR
jgi:hypothetical protein